MTPWLDKKLEKHFLPRLHKKREKIIQQTLSTYFQTHSLTPELKKTFEKQLRNEADRVYAIVDASILRARIRAAKYTFWMTAVAGIILSGVIIVLSGGTALPIITLLLGGVIAYLVTLGTIPISYNLRVLGGMDSAIDAFEKSLTTSSDLDSYMEENKITIQNLQTTLTELIKNLSAPNKHEELFALLTDEQKEMLNLSAEVIPQPEAISKENFTTFANQLNELTQQMKVFNQRLENMESLLPQPQPSINCYSNQQNKTHFWRKLHHHKQTPVDPAFQTLTL